VDVDVTSRTENGVAILGVSGELDLYTSPKLRAAIEGELAQGRVRLILNLLNTTYLDSTALSILSEAHREVRRRNGNLGLVYQQPQVARIFSITGLAEVFPIFATEAEALVAAQTWSSAAPTG
jgi:anti-sigma B factor antagonist